MKAADRSPRDRKGCVVLNKSDVSNGLAEGTLIPSFTKEPPAHGKASGHEQRHAWDFESTNFHDFIQYPDPCRSSEQRV